MSQGRVPLLRQGNPNYQLVFMLGKGVLFEKSGTEQFKVMAEIDKFQGDFYVCGVCLKSHGLVGSSTCPIGWMDDLYGLIREADKVVTF